MDHSRIALGVQQPWAELILQGIKTIEVRTRSTKIRGPVYLYASKTFSRHPQAQEVIEEYSLDMASLPSGLIVGQFELYDCRELRPSDAKASCISAEGLTDCYAWELRNPKRLEQPVPPGYLPYGIWFYPFERRGNS